MLLALRLGILASTNIAFAMFIQWYVLVTVGPGMETDAWFVGITIPQLMVTLVGTSLTNVLVPLLAGEERAKLQRNAWGLFIMIGALFLSVALLLFSLAHIWMPFLVPGFPTEGKALAIQLTRIQLISMTMTACTGVLRATYQAKKQFLWTEIAPLFGTLIGLAFLFWALPHYGIVAAAWTTVVRTGLEMLLLIPALGHYQKPDWHTNTFKVAWRRLKPLLAGSAYYRSEPIVNNYLASLAHSGELSLLYFSRRLFTALHRIVSRAIITPILPSLAMYVKDQDFRRYRSIYRGRLVWLLGITGGASIVIYGLGLPMVNQLIGYKGITPERVYDFWLILVSFSGMFVTGAMGALISSSFYAMGNTATPVKVGVIGYTLGIILRIGGFFIFGVVGIAIATTIYYSLNFLVLFGLLESQMRNTINGEE